MSPKQREAVEHAYLAIKVLEHLLRSRGLPMGVQAARDTLAKLQEAFPSIEDRTARRVAADAVTTGTGYARTTEDGTLQHVPVEEVHIDEEYVQDLLAVIPAGQTRAQFARRCQLDIDQGYAAEVAEATRRYFNARP